MNALETVGVTLLDHLIFTETEYLSFADSIYLQRTATACRARSADASNMTDCCRAFVI